jgi:hypothetical protein
MLNAKRYAPMNARDKMPFEVTPIFYKLQRYDTTANQPPTPPAAPPADQQLQPPAGDQQPAAPPADQQQQQPAAPPNAGL